MTERQPALPVAESNPPVTLGGRSHAPELPLPYFEAWRGDGAPTEERFLLVAPHFPPDPSVRALRWERFATPFAERGRKLDVLTRQPSEWIRAEWDRLEALPVGTRAYGVDTRELPLDRLESILRGWLGRDPAPERTGHATAEGTCPPAEEAPGKPASPRGLYRAYRAWRHLRRAETWIGRAVSLGTSLALTVDYRAVVSSGPPHEAHVAAQRIARRIGRPLVLDLQAPWSLLEAVPEPRAGPVWLRRAGRVEDACIAEARLVVAASDPHRKALAERHPEAAGRIATVLSGFDADRIEESGERTDSFSMVHVGSVDPTEDALHCLLRASRRIVRSLGLTPDDFRIEFLGDVSGDALGAFEALAREAGVGDYFEVQGALPRPRALRRASQAAVLLNLPQRSGLCIPAEIYEYLRMDGYILALQNPDTATARLLDGTDSDVVEPGDVEAVARVVRNRYQAFAKGQLPPSAPPDPDLAREAQAEKFLRLLAEHLDRGASAHV